jgi:sugar lactone lactonase YvrE
MKNVRTLLWWTLAVALLVGATAAFWWQRQDQRPALARDWTATVGVIGEDGRWAEPFAVTAAPDGTLFVADGARGNRVWAVSPTGNVAVVAGGNEGFLDGYGRTARFHTPSGVALDRNGILFVADTGNDAIRRIGADGQVSTVATGLNGPVGIAIDAVGRMFVADTYNDRVVAINPQSDRQGVATPIAIDVALDTPTGLALDAAGTIYIADTGNNVVRAVDRSGRSTTIDPVDIGGFQRPVGVAVDARGSLLVTDEGGRIVEIGNGGMGARVVAGSSPGFHNGPGLGAQFRRPTAVVALEPGRLVVADSGNALLRTVTATTLADAVPPPSPFIAPQFDRAAFAERPLLWPLDPLTGPFEIAGTMGEARGQDGSRFHAGIDVRAEQGNDVLAVRDGVVSAPVATSDFGSLSEWLRIGELTYVHLRAGRTRRGELVDSRRFVATRDERGGITRVRVKRGASFRTGDVVGSVNAFNHVHLNIGWGGEEHNPLLFRLVQFEDTVAPTIARGGVRLIGPDGAQIVNRRKGRLRVSGPVQIVVDAWDQANGNRPSRRLGVYALGYQVLTADGRPAPGFAQPRETITFNQLGMTQEATRLVYAAGSGIPFYGQRRTRFLYVVTNVFRDGVATPGMWDTATLPPGDYTLRIKVVDVNGNEAIANRDVAITVTGREHTAGG